ncbi:hypothetical protein BVC80_7857g6 [Macleaya cordata]|uniref:Uncharacterized protein n=1 Tax=Macleaya cordata TaxID=56857 RepID=A0A200PY90_MACCD|nr:hypothetical protein BVC80_7857g6 [Macleaya cordata]
MPVSTSDKISNSQQDFWWGKDKGKKGIYLKAWAFMYRPKSIGGLDFQNPRMANLANLARIDWRLIQNPEALWAKIIKPKYYPNLPSPLSDNISKSGSWIWTYHKKDLGHIKDNYIWDVGVGSQICIWSRNWVPGIEGPLDPKEGFIPNDIEMVSELLNTNTVLGILLPLIGPFLSRLARKL